MRPTAITAAVTAASAVLAILPALHVAQRTSDAAAAGIPEGRIAFASNRTGNYDIYVMLPDGSGLVDVTSNPAADRLPAWSPDGSRIAFRSTRTGNGEIFVMNADGSGVTQLTLEPASDSGPSWTPEGTILFSSVRSGHSALYEMNADGTDVRRIGVELEGDLLLPRASREGNRISFERRSPTGEVAVWIAHRDGSHANQLTDDAMAAAQADWSPHGSKRIAFANNVCPTCDVSHVFVMNAAGNHVRQVTEGPTNDNFPSWSPDGSRLAFYGGSPENAFVPDVFVVNEDGSAVTNLTDHPAADVEPAWGAENG